jgi:uncharacterized circularly permuted ATP-grasp superfamily protein
MFHFRRKEMTANPIADYNAILSRYAPQIGEINDKVNAELERRRILYGGAVTRTFLRPSILTTAQFSKLERACNVLIRAVNTILDNIYDGSVEKMGSSLGIAPEELEITRLDPGYELLVAINRMDAFVEGDSLTFLEFNCDSPAGIAYADELGEVLRKTPFFAEFEKRHPVRGFSGRAALLDAFVRIYRQWGGTDPMRIAIVDWKDVATSPEFDIFQAYFEHNGVPCIVADPRDAAFDGGTLTFDGVPVNFVYKRVITGELLNKRDEVKPLLDAYRARAACFANSFRSRLADNKVIFSLLTDQAFADRFSREEREIAAETIPWTRRVADTRTLVGDAEVDLLEYIRRHREELVMKPNTDYGGRNVYIGAEVDSGEWDDVIEQALRGDWVVQRKVRIPEEPFPVITDEGLTFEPRRVNINPFALGGRYGGCASRLSTESIINVRVGGGAVPLFVVEA